MSAPAMEKPLLSGLSPDLERFASLRALRAQALAIATEKGLPSHREEEFKYTPLTSLAETHWVPAGTAQVDLAALIAHPLFGFDQTRLVFVNGVFSPELSENVEANGFTFLPLEQAIEQGLTEGKLGTLATVEEATFEVAAHLGSLRKPVLETLPALNTACFTTGAYLRLDKNQKVEAPIHLVYVSTGANSTTTPRTLVVAESGSEANLIETYLSSGEDTTLTVPVTEIFVAANATLEHIRIGDENLNAVNVGQVEVRQEGDSTYRSYNVVFGARLTRNDINIFIDGSNAHTRFDGVVAISGEQHADNHTRLDHAKPHCESFEIYKHLLADKARAVFNGKIFVHQDAQKTDAKQTNMTLLLSPNAQVDTKPQLEIFADDVKCTHGATVGQLRKDAMFYLKSRGISEKQAQALLVYAFAAEVMELIEHEGARQALEAMLFEKLGTGRSE